MMLLDCYSNLIYTNRPSSLLCVFLLCIYATAYTKFSNFNEFSCVCTTIHYVIVRYSCPFACSLILLLFHFTEFFHLQRANLHSQKEHFLRGKKGTVNKFAAKPPETRCSFSHSGAMAHQKIFPSRTDPVNCPAKCAVFLVRLSHPHIPRIFAPARMPLREAIAP